ncbi:MAG: hypothetical protein R3E91_04005 [Chlamydiales bacterium]
MKNWFIILLLPLNLWAHEIIVESNEMYYDGNIITLIGQVSVENMMGKITTEKALLKYDKKKIGKIEFSSIEITQDIKILFPNGSHLNCDFAFIDCIKMTGHFTGSSKVTYFDEKGEVSADEAFVDYIEIEKSISLRKIHLINNVKLIFRDHSQYLLADSLMYYPDKELMILEGNNEQQVLFFDQADKIQISAPRLYVLQNPKTRKHTIQGEGDVRFIFQEEEFKKLKEEFKW